MPKPKDWPPHVQVVGNLGVKQGEATKVDEHFGPLLAWLEQGAPPIFIGFGSMVIADTARLQQTLALALALALALTLTLTLALALDLTLTKARPSRATWVGASGRTGTSSTPTTARWTGLSSAGRPTR